MFETFEMCLLYTLCFQHFFLFCKNMTKKLKVKSQELMPKLNIRYHPCLVFGKLSIAYMYHKYV